MGLIWNTSQFLRLYGGTIQNRMQKESMLYLGTIWNRTRGQSTRPILNTSLLLKHYARTIQNRKRGQSTGEGGPMRGLETDAVISGPIKGLTININERGQTYKHTYRHCDSLTEPGHRAERRDNQVNYRIFYILLDLFSYKSQAERDRSISN